MNMNNSEIKIKKCVKCNKEKLTSDFNKDKGKKDGLDKVCRDCRKEWKQANREKINENNKANYLSHPRILLTEEENKQHQREYHKRTYQPTPRVLLTNDEKKRRNKECRRVYHIKHPKI